MPYTLNQPVRELTPPFVYFHDVFTPAECDAIKALSSQLEMKEAVLGVTGAIDPLKRISKAGWIIWAAPVDWIFARLADVVYKANGGWYHFNLSAFNEALQLTQYIGSENGHYDWHQDLGAQAMSCRKLSLSVLLSDPKDFEGGELEIFSVPGENKVAEMKQGSVILFPAWESHRVKPVTKGERWSTVAWVSGPPFS